jgi:putative ABC transport system permease protein
VFGYYFQLALRSLRRNVVLTSLAVLAIGVGIGASMSMLTILRAASGDPIPQKSAQLFLPQIDNWGPIPGAPAGGQDQLPPDLTYIDAMALMRAHAAPQQAAMYPTTPTVTVPGTQELPLQGRALATDNAFFSMFDVPFEYGGPWSQREDDAHEAVVVLTREFNDQLFGGANSVGRRLTIDGKLYRVIGVVDAWHPRPLFYEIGGNSYSNADQLFLPFTRAIDEQMQNTSYLGCGPRGNPGNGWSGLLQSSCNWIQVWIDLPTARDVAAYRTFLRNYAAEQRQDGRFDWPAHVALRDVMQWLAYNHVVPVAVRTLSYVSLAILLVCVLNATGLLLAKFMARAPGVGVRRALGATRAAVFAQCLVEAGVIGLVGGLVGVGLTKVGLMGCRAVLAEDLSVLMQLRLSNVVIALAVAILATLLAGLYPTWRAAQVQPASQLKTQ